ncbi:MAG: DUF6677 family protein [Planctomycetota bacterium]|jgi:hypothetical protein
MARRSRESQIVFLPIVGLLAWLVPGAGHLLLGKNRHAIVIFVTVVLTLGAGLYIGSIGVINPVGAKPWYVAQVMNTPAVAALGQVTRQGYEHRRPAQSVVYRKCRVPGSFARNRGRRRLTWAN